MSMLISDLLITNFSFILSGFIVNLFLFHGRQTMVIFQLLVLFNITWFGAALFFRLYKLNVFHNMEETYRRSYKTAILQALIFSLFLYSNSYKLYTVKAIVFCYSFMFILLMVSRLALTYVTNFVIKKANLHKKIAIVGYNPMRKQLANYFENNKNIYSFEGFFDNRALSSSHVTADGNIVGSIADCMDYAIENSVTEIYSTILPNQHRDILQLVDRAENNCVRVKFIAAHTDTSNFDDFPSREFVDSLSVTGFRSEPLNLLKNRVKKRMADIVISMLVIMFVLSWLVPLMAVLIKLSSPGPVFFRQQRSGKDNNVFWCIKFRSMTVNTASDNQQASKNDARITRIGAFMRKTSIDEMPQFLNVLAGNMSICGPRPHMLLHTSMYRHSINKYMVRHLVKPGITGWAQVNGYRGETADRFLMEKRVEHDIWYLEHWSSMLDLKIIFLTVLNAVRGEENAY